MAIYGIGAYYTSDVSEDFLNNDVIGTGWDYTEASDLHEYFKVIEPGDIVYIKSKPIGQPVIVKGIGLVSGPRLISGRFGSTNIEIGRTMQWLDRTRFTLPVLPGKNDVRTNTMYRETHPGIIKIIMTRLEKKLKKF